LKKYILLSLGLIFGAFLQGNANVTYKYTGKWKSSDERVELILKWDGRCILKKKLKILVNETECIWDKINHFVTYGKPNKKEVFYFKLDNNELLIEQDKRSLTREKADLIMHKIK